jgi:hypothetical protein
MGVSRKLASGLCLAAGLALVAVGARAGNRAPSAARDLHYGEVLFHYYQQDYFGALVHLAVARSRNTLKRSREEAELLRGGLSLDYGMRARAREIFRRLLNGDVSARTRGRAWLALARSAWRSGEPRKALSALDALDNDAAATLNGEDRLLRGLALLSLDRPDEAATVLEQAPDDSPLSDFALLNDGIARLRGGSLDAALTRLDAVGSREPAGGETGALQDRANLAAGYALLQADRPDDAAVRFNRIRADGPYTRQGLLGAGWAADAAGRTAEALAPWRRLAAGPARSSPVQEALLAVPYSYARLGRASKAAGGYERAVAAFEDQRKRLDKAIATVADGGLRKAVESLPADRPAHWLGDFADILDPDLAAYLGDLLAENDFRLAVIRLQELRRLHNNLSDWLGRMDTFDTMLANREAQYRERLPQTRSALSGLDLAQLRKHRDALAARIEAIENSGDATALLTPKQTKAWERLDDIGKRLESLPPDAPEAAPLRHKHRVFKGLLRWQATRNYAARLWDAKKALKNLDTAIADLTQRAESLRAAPKRARAGFQGFAGRIDGQRRRIKAVMPDILDAMQAQARVLEQLTERKLEQRRRLLQAQLAEARFALARLYDRPADDSEAR